VGRGPEHEQWILPEDFQPSKALTDLAKGVSSNAAFDRSLTSQQIQNSLPNSQLSTNSTPTRFHYGHPPLELPTEKKPRPRRTDPAPAPAALRQGGQERSSCPVCAKRSLGALQERCIAAGMYMWQMFILFAS
jgi:hypothetical protein